MDEENRANEVLENLDRGVEELKLVVQQRTVRLAQEFFGDSAELLRRQVREHRATLERLPDEIPGGQEEAFQAIFLELTNNYAAIEGVLDEAEKNVAGLDPEQLMEQGEMNASEAARREASELGVDLTEVEGTGTDGRIIVSDVIEAVEAAGDADGPKASEAVRRRAEELGVDLSKAEGTGTGGLITVTDVMSLAGEAEQEAAEAAGRGAEQATDAAGEAAAEADGAVDRATEEAGGEENGEGPKATNAARRKAEELGVDLEGIEGSGARGLITVKDVVNG